MAGVINFTSMEGNLHGCKFTTSVNLYLVFAGAGGLILNILPLYVVIKFQRHAPRTGRDILLAALCVLDLLTLLIPLPIYLSVQDECPKTENTSKALDTSRSSICEMFYLMFIWLKLSAMFLVTILNYTSYLALNNRGLYKSTSIGDRISSSFYCSHANSRSREKIYVKGRSSVVLANLVIGIALVAFIISSLPYLGLGPEGENFSANFSALNHDRYPRKDKHLCRLEQISQPKKGKEYTFLFAVLMSSSACFILHVVHSILSRFSQFLWKKNLKQAQELDMKVIDRSLVSLENAPKIAQSYAKMTCTLGIAYFATWIPLMVAMGNIMSNYHITAHFGEYSVAATFVNPLLGPVIYAVFITEYREGYGDLLRRFLSLLHVCKECIMIKSNKPAQGLATTTTTTEYLTVESTVV